MLQDADADTMQDTVQSPAVQKGVSLKCSSFTKIFLGYTPMING